MPDSLLATLAQRLHLPTPAPIDPATQATIDAQAQVDQQGWSPLHRALADAPVRAMNFAKGLIQSDPTVSREQFDQPGYGAGTVLGAALPLFGAKGIPGMYSRVEKIAEALPEGGVTAGKLATILKNRASNAEVDWRGIPEMLEDVKGHETVPKQALVSHLQQHPLDVNVIRRGGYSPTISPDQIPQYHNYVMPGASNYREDLLQLPEPQTPEDSHFPTTYMSHHWDEPNVLVHVRHNERQIPLTNLPEGFGTVTGETERFEPGSWVEGRQADPTNTIRGWNHYMGPSAPTKDEAIAKAKMDLGPRGRMLENIQSDWQQRGAQGGFAGDTGISQSRQAEEAEQNVSTTRQALDAQNQRIIGMLNQGTMPALPPKEDHHDVTALSYDLLTHLRDMGHDYPVAEDLAAQIQHARVLHDNALDAAHRLANQGVPDMPFKDTSGPPELALKQQLLDIAHNHPDLQWLGIAPSSELKARGEDISPEFQDKMLPNLLEKLIKPFGGSVERGVDLGMKSENASSPMWDGSIGNYGGFREAASPYGTGHEILSLLPDRRTAPRDISGMDTIDTMRRTLYAQHPNITSPGLARLTPEMLAQIKQKGFPLLMALLASHAASHSPNSDRTHP